MINVGKNFLRTVPIIKQFARTNTRCSAVCIFQNDYSPEEYERILHKFNTADPIELVKYDMSSSRVMELIKWRAKKGIFTSLSEVLNIGVIGEDRLRSVCNNIAAHQIGALKMRPRKQVRAFVSPDTPLHILHSLYTTVAVHIDPYGIGWAKLDKEQNQLIDWSYEELNLLPKKLLTNDIFQLAVNVLNKIPPGDVYIFEAAPTLTPQNHSQKSVVVTYNQQMELVSMLLALLNTSSLHNIALQRNPDSRDFENRVFFIKRNIPARLFKTLLGFEKVSAVSIINDFLNQSSNDYHFGCCTPIVVENELRDMFHAQSSKNKELLSQALMLGCAFMDLCVYKNPNTINALTSRKKMGS